MEENIILARPVQVIFDSEDLLVVEKPASVPVHAGGSYKQCTLVGLLEAGRWEGETKATPSFSSSSSVALEQDAKVEAWHVEGKALQYTVPKLHTTHRLDRLTSGLVLLAKTKQKAQKLFSEFKEDKIQKTYLCKVKGNFFDLESNSMKLADAGLKLQVGKPADNPGLALDPDLCAKLADASDFSEEEKRDFGRFRADLEGWIKCKDFKIGVHVFLDKPEDEEDHAAKRRKLEHELAQPESLQTDKKSNQKERKMSDANEPKWSRTRFFPIIYDPKSNTSIVVAQPETGRTHQIRVHLQRLGFEIANDPNYGPADFELRAEDDYPLFPGGHRSGIFLHAWQYEGPGWKHQSTVPWWCTPSKT